MKLNNIHPNAKNRIVINKGDVFGRLKFIEEIRIGNRRIWKCLCNCWNIVQVRMFNLKSWDTLSCWCYGKENAIKSRITHWLSKHRLFKIYVCIMHRCNDVRDISYSRYGGRGIKCEWINVEDFIKDMWASYKEWLTIDRIDNDWNYCKENCRWATRKEQSKNRSSNLIYKWKCVSDWCTELWINKQTIYARIKSWLSIWDALAQEIR